MFFQNLFPPKNMWSAAERGDLPAIERLVSSGHDPNCKRQTSDAATPLHLAARAGRMEAIRLLVNRGAKINAKDSDGMTALTYALTESQRCDVTGLLLDLGANIDAQDNSGMTALDHAVFGCYNKLVEFLLKRGARPNVGERGKRSSSVYHSVSAKNMEALRLLIASNADVNAQHFGSSPLSVAAVNGLLEFAKCLLDAGAVPNSSKDSEYTDLMSAVAGGSLAMVRMLVEARAVIDAVHPITKETALDIAENRGKAEIAIYLRNIGAKRANELSTTEKEANGAHWQLPNEMFLSARVETAPPKAGPAAIHVEVSSSDSRCFSGVVEYRMASDLCGFGEWKRLFVENAKEDGSVEFSDSTLLVQGLNVVEFRVRKTECEDFVYPSAWSITAI